jgi:hypothetical protein
MSEVKNSSQLKNWLAVNIIVMVGGVFAIGEYIQKVDNHITDDYIHMSFDKSQRFVLKDEYQKDVAVDREDMKEIKEDIKDIKNYLLDKNK